MESRNADRLSIIALLIVSAMLWKNITA